MVIKMISTGRVSCRVFPYISLEVCFYVFKFPIIAIIQEVDNGHFDWWLCICTASAGGWGKVHYWEAQPGCSLSPVGPQLNATGSA